MSLLRLFCLVLGCPKVHYVGGALPNPWHTLGYGVDNPDYSDPNHLLKEGFGIYRIFGPDFSNQRVRNDDTFDPDRELQRAPGPQGPNPIIDNYAPPVQYPPKPSLPLAPPRSQPEEKSEKKSEGDSSDLDVFATSADDPLTFATLPGSDTLWDGGDSISSSIGSLDPIPSLDDPSLAIAAGPDLSLFNSNADIAGIPNTELNSADLEVGTELGISNADSGDANWFTSNADSGDANWLTSNAGNDDANMFVADAGNDDANLFTDFGVSRRVKRSPRDFRF